MAVSAVTEAAKSFGCVTQPGTELEWDAKEMKITNVPEANKHLGRTYRKGW